MKYVLLMHMALLSAVLTASCSQAIDSSQKEDNTYIPIAQRSELEDLKSNTAKAVWHMGTAIEAALEAAEYYVPLSERSAAASLEDLARALPADLSSLKRKTESRSAAGEEETISLKQELEAIADAFDEAMIQLVPPLEDISLPEGYRIEDGLIWMSEDEQVPLYSLEGIAIAEILTAQAEGKDLTKTMIQVNAEIEKLLSVSDTNSRGIYQRGITRWIDGIIYYEWDSSVSPDYRKEIREAMDEWERKTGKVSFREYGPRGFSYLDFFDSRFNIRRVVTIRTRYLGGSRGRATVGGATPGRKLYMHFAPDLKTGAANRWRDDSLYPTALHELGHVLGLMHEHQRSDRDRYIDLSETLSANPNNHNYAMLQDTSTTRRWRFEWRTIRILFFIIIPVPTFVPYWHTEILTEKTDWDWNSVMLYDGLRIKKPYANATNGKKKNGVYVTRNLPYLSARDVAIVKRMY